MGELDQDRRYLEIILSRLMVCRDYKPKLGQGKDISVEQFQALYRADPLYNWFGLADPLIYAAHKAAGGITSIYRQIGLGCEELFRQILKDELELSEADVKWSYHIETGAGRERTLSLDARIPLKQVTDQDKRKAVAGWLQKAAQQLGVDAGVAEALRGPVFEVRQGYKSKDSKRQNADITNAASAYKAGYLPTIVLLSLQIDDDIAHRYAASGILLLYGTTSGSPITSTYIFCRDIIGYDLAAFFENNAKIFQDTVNEIVKNLLSI
ncbi:MAG: hypothetical protein JXB47_02360 [Anaerolineae bacterium]|nr:hypothetical protein [Anaerolineae bacterium]